MNLVLAGKKGLDKCLFDAICPFIRGKSDNSRLPFSQGDKNSSSPTTDHRIHLPITNPRTFFNDAGAMIYRDPCPVGQCCLCVGQAARLRLISDVLLALRRKFGYVLLW
ncbi:MAG: hypothetical protein CDV28_101148 [Candidatus Electronema aureum]|uniref:Uncharacterized protein n=1 Tax=Candidatus Electronema aureum TaxID=2005002 RepID=A0A521G5E4_9BACT|nr:MAG: hypothetical protein CDV28_101148 [Candidatus Electronema aureum]